MIACVSPCLSCLNEWNHVCLLHDDMDVCLIDIAPCSCACMVIVMCRLAADLGYKSHVHEKVLTICHNMHGSHVCLSCAL